MAQIIWSPEAFRNLDEISDYMRLAAPEQADTLVAGVVAAVRPTSTFPYIGRKMPEFDRETLRELIFQSYRIVYVVRGETIWVAHVFHTSMDIAARLRELIEDD